MSTPRLLTVPVPAATPPCGPEEGGASKPAGTAGPPPSTSPAMATTGGAPVTRSVRDRRPRENQIMAEPATVDRCQRDYRHGAADRSTACKQMRRAEASRPS
jgi:hypothetical protein